MTALAPALELDRVSFSYGSAPVLDDVSLRIAQGRFVALIGANGAGKSTLVQLALGLLRPSSGTVRLFGTPSESFNDRHHIGYVPQRASTASALPISVEEVVVSGLAAVRRTGRRLTQLQRDRVDHVLDLQGLTALRRRRLAELSGGQQQRALIARALVTGPRLLVLDEPTTGVDAAARAVLKESLQHLVAVEQVAVVYVSHDPEGFAGLAHRVVEVCACQLVERPDCCVPQVDPHVAGGHALRPVPVDVRPPGEQVHP